MEVTYNEKQLSRYNEIVNMLSKLFKTQLLMLFIFFIPVAIGIILFFFTISIFWGLLLMFFGGLFFVPVFFSYVYNARLLFRARKRNLKIIRTSILENPERIEQEDVFFYEVFASGLMFDKKIMFVNPVGEKLYTEGDEVDIIVTSNDKPVFAIASLAYLEDTDVEDT